MKKCFILSAMLVSFLILGLAFVSCDDSNEPSSGTNPFVGTWEGNDLDGDWSRMVFASTTWTMTWPGNPQWGSYSGSYTFSGNTANLREGNVAIGTATVSGNTMTIFVPGEGTFTLTRR